MNGQARRAVPLGVLVLVALFAIIWSAMGRMEGFWISSEALGTWFAAFLTLAILSFLYDDNPIYRFAESLFIGVSAAYWMVQGVWQTLIMPDVEPLFAPMLYAVPAQLIAYHTAVFMGTDVDQPRNLAKSVTVE